ncbi:MAG: DUF2520 domain-containing protein [Desulfotalea sp.]
MKKIPPCGIVGDGRAANHFARYLKLSKIPFKQWSRKENNGIEPAVFFKDCKIIFLLIKDGAIENFISSNQKLKQFKLFHFSGSLCLKDIPSIHPLMTFTNELYSLEKYQEIPFVHEKGKPSLQELLPSLSNPCHPIEAEDKPLYHALCVLSGNFSTILWQKVFKDFPLKLGLPAEILLPYMQQTFLNLENNTQGALTGPIARRDTETIASNLQALTGDKYQTIYTAFVKSLLDERK